MKTRIIVGINDFLIGGAQRLIVDQLQYADRERFDWVLITLLEFPERKDFYAKVPADIPVHRVDMRGAYDLRGWVRLIRLLSRLRPRYVISHLFFTNTVFRLLKRWFRYDVYTVEHNTYVNKRRWQVLVDRCMAAISTKVIAVSEEVRNFTIGQQHIAPERCICIENGLDRAPLQRFMREQTFAEARARLGIRTDATCLLSVGRLTAQKNQRLLLDGYARYLNRLSLYERERTILLLAGEGELRGTLEAQAQLLGIVSNVWFLGATTDMFPYYRAADVLVSTSEIEGLSMAYLEALNFGLPLVATRTGGTGRLLNDGLNGFFITSFEPTAVVDALMRWKVANMQVLQANARSIAERYDVRINIAKYEQLLLTDVNN